MLFLTISAVTGLLWAYAPHLYWQPGYKEAKRKFEAAKLSANRVSLDAVEQSAARAGCVNPPAFNLSVRAGRWVWQLKCPEKSVLIDAVSGLVLSPLSDELARTFADEYVPAGFVVSNLTRSSAWLDRKPGAKPRDAWVVRYGDSKETEIVIDASTGEVLEESDTVRRFHFWVTKLHQFQFFGTAKTLTAMSGVPLLILIVTGVRMLLVKKRKS